MKRLRHKKCEPGQLRMYWGPGDNGDYPDVFIVQGGAEGQRRDSALLYSLFCAKRPAFGKRELEPSVLDTLKARGYDITTLEFSIKRLSQPGGGGL